MNYTYSQQMLQIIRFSKEEAARLDEEVVTPVHLMLAMIRDEDNKAVEILQNVYHVDLRKLKQDLETKAHSDQGGQSILSTPPTPEDVVFDVAASALLRLSILESKVMKADEIHAEHLLLGMLKQRNNAPALLLREYNITYKDVAMQLTSRSQSESKNEMHYMDNDEDDDVVDNPRLNQSGNKTNGTTARNEKDDTPALDAFGYDLTRAACEGKLDPVVGRDQVIERVAQILSRRKKNNPVLIGDPGVGKTAVVEGLAQRIVSGQVNGILRGKRVLSLDVNAIVAGTKFRGQFEERMKNILRELTNHPEIIVFIDEIHTIVGAGNQSGQMDVANLLKPALSRGEIQCVGATTAKEYRKSIETDGALERRFQRVSVEATSVEETLQILHNIKSRYEDYHHVRYTDEALETCVRLAERYITNRQQPDKSIDVLDEVGARTHLLNTPVPNAIVVKEKEIADMVDKKNKAVKSQNYELAASMRDRVRVLEVELGNMRKEWLDSMDSQSVEISAERVAETVSQMTGVPMQQMAVAELTRLKNMRQELKESVKGQDEAIDKIVRAIQRNRIGLSDPNRPIGTFLFLGPTGVGKTYLAKQLAKLMFGSSEAMVRVDMSEYSEAYTVSRLVGSAPGYVGYDDGGQLTEQVRKKPYSIVLFDELEKAHKNIFSLLLQVLDDGRLTDSSGRTVNFRNTVIILTSNTGSRDLQDFKRGIGFTSEQGSAENDRMSEILNKALCKQFPPEFLNRIDEVVSFNALSKDTVFSIVRHEIQPLVKRLYEQGYGLDIDDAACKLLAQKGFDPKYGARPLRRAIQTYVEDAISQLIFEGGVQKNSTFIVRCSENGKELNITTGTSETDKHEPNDHVGADEKIR